jgi:V-type H+-transporting ATPase subunit d
MKLHLACTDYGNFLQNEPSPLATTTVAQKCTEKLVHEFNYLRCHATKPLATFLDYITSPPPPPIRPTSSDTAT